MARKPKKSEFLRSLGIFWQIWKSLTDEVLGLGGSDEDLRRIETDGKLRREVAELIVRRKEKKPARPLFPSERLAADLIPDNWEVVEDVEPSEFEVGDLAFPGFLMEGETCIDGEEMRRRAVQLKANFGLVDGKRLLAHQDEIPVELRGKAIVLSGTLLRDPDGRLYVACLDWDDDRWYLGFFWLGGGWRVDDRLVRRK
ncbi:MAG: hypothetical protein A3C90_02585 [Candidatus Magasanikbacteria bacterium RIFCSPHIGHO2_02_FULL_51_14]|uniref:Uncharacterized protein n=1 Tax=Candidatus Magasanikbacteria bacterium RIFCSPHIGHO2_02_FULL_51_14 TaxID=1798683 RepID=A0A1F6MEY8_9BACT|nr:MAG: hypothetical protein A3C90_02585 [Candidatus Magasanikbacteria bacterium RIFCSPHIGHO2_02_FULL_51_14]